MWPHGIRRAPRSRHRTERHGWESLTPTENRVVELVVRGMSNPQIADELYLSPRTVGTHMSHILAKLEPGLAVNSAERGHDGGSVEAPNDVQAVKASDKYK